MKLFYAPGACSLSPHIALHEAGLQHELEKVDIRAGGKLESGGQFGAINGKGYVPALQIDGGPLLTEGPAIVQYIADQAPASGLAPAAGSIERYRLQEWLNFISTELHKGMGSMFNPAQTPEWRAAASATLSKRLNWLSEALGDKPFLMGERFTVADGYLFTVLRWAGPVKFDLSPWPALVAFRDRVAERPAVKAALKMEGLN
ncbi:glutathione transferase GstA [Roseomonas haemaphysalidis]|uniref:Glutathione transferase GstA n=1 Tax=Roseomonas haemaphysalidis TaxID=2768162 RepID=A0ABS3KNK9_9PROT|nr:glutathione transferase GstA [Roseomonas haemaphysalidis]MBO1078183.1 glutathione transferase GstA [Roseomonas haemaphysalidis]